MFENVYFNICKAFLSGLFYQHNLRAGTLKKIERLLILDTDITNHQIPCVSSKATMKDFWCCKI